MIRQFSKAVLLSLAIHLAVAALIIWKSPSPPEGALGEYIVSVDVISSLGGFGGAGKKGLGTAPRKVFSRGTIKSAAEKGNLQKAGQDSATEESGSDSGSDGDGGGGQAGNAGSGGTNPILARIKAKIESAKRYPTAARQMRIEGKPVVMFKINSDGSIKYVKIAKTSGEQMLDDAALETIHRAAPLPYYEDPIRLAIRYEIR